MAGLLAAGVIVAANCGTPMTSPGPTPTPTPPNTPPVIKSFTASSLQVEAGQQVTFTAVVEDAETPVTQLLYSWSETFGHGTTSGLMTSGSDPRTMTWTAPVGQPTPDDRTFTLTVTEDYTSNGVAQQNKVTSAPITIHYNDSVAEISNLSLTFLTDFANYSMTPDECLRNFATDTPDCATGRSDEFGDITGNRANFKILSANPLFINTLQTHRDGVPPWAEVALTCVFHDIPTTPGMTNYLQQEKVPGICTLTAIYERGQWFLCTSHFTSTANATPESLRFRVPGQIVDRPRRLPQ